MIAFMMLLLACGIGRSATEIPQPSGGPIEPNQEASQRAQENFNQAFQESSNDHLFEMRISDEEITSLVALQLKQEAEIPLSEPQIWFKPGKVYITGKVEGVLPTALPALIVARPSVNSQGQLEITVDEARMGNFNLPDSLVENLTQTTNETLAELQLEIQIREVEALEGELLLSGTRVEP